MIKRKRHNRSANYFIYCLAFILLAGAFVFFWQTRRLHSSNRANQNIDTSDYVTPPMPSENQNSGPIGTTTVKTEQSIPAKELIEMRFTSQAPFGVWDALHEDACEEASFLMVKHYLDKTPLGTSQEIDDQIKELISYEEQNGYGPSITVEELSKIAKDRYGMIGEVKPATVENIEADIALGHPVIVPAAGKLLPNPNFRNGGPNYHMLVIKGYDENNFITNDPGTRKGENFVYTHSALINAAHNWDPNNILNGSSAYLVF